MTTPEPKSKDNFFAQLADISGAMTEAYGKDFAMGALVLAARFLAEGEARANTAGATGAAAAAQGAKPATSGVPRSDAAPASSVPQKDESRSAIWTPGKAPTEKNTRH